LIFNKIAGEILEGIAEHTTNYLEGKLKLDEMLNTI
jgi:hypothetical protein